MSILNDIANDIVGSIGYNFEDKYITHNLVDSIYIVDNGDDIEIHIPAPQYDFSEWKKGKFVLYNGGAKSYASYVNDISGGFSGLHYNFVNNAIADGIWANGCEVVSSEGIDIW